MKKVSKLLLLGVLVFTLYSVHCTLYASFVDIGVGPRALGMGGAFTGLANDGYAAYYNPAGLAQLTEKEIDLSYTALFAGLTYGGNISNGFMGYAHPLDPVIGILGFSWINLYSEKYQENVYNISYARWMAEFDEKLLIGANIKILQLGYVKSDWGIDESTYDWSEGGIVDPIFADGYSAIGFGIDVGALYYLNDKLSAGIMVKDINQPDVHLKDPNVTPITVKTGVSYSATKQIVSLADITFQSDGLFRFNGGAEYSLENYPIVLRGGFGVGSNNYLNMAMGASYSLKDVLDFMQLQMDYAFTLPFSGLEGTLGSHRIGMSMKFK